MPVISELFTYPLKSAQGISHKELQLTSRGPAGDRDWMVVNKNNRFFTQRQKPKMCLIHVNQNGSTLTLNAPNMPQLTVAPSTTNIIVDVWKDSVNVQDCGDEAAHWLSKFLEVEQCRLVYMPQSTQRQIDTEFAKEGQLVSFADGFPSLITSQASLDDFNNKLETPISTANFRPNIVIGDCEPYAEDTWKEIRVNGILFSLVKPCSRCVIPSINQETAEKQKEVLLALNEHRRRERATYFGQNALHDQTGVIKVGDAVEIIS